MASPSRSKVYFFFPYDSFYLKKRNDLKKNIETLFRKEGKRLVHINYIFSTDKNLLELNKKYLFHNFYTDILTFYISDNKKKVEAEVYISVERVRENALNHKTTFIEELHRVIFHGALHLCGYKDKSHKEILRMRKQENFYLSAFFK